MPHNSDVIGKVEAAFIMAKGIIIYTAVTVVILAAVYATIGFGTAGQMPYGVI